MREIIKDDFKLPKIFLAILLVAIGVIGRLTLSNFLPESPAIYLTINGITQPLFMMDLFFIVAIIAILSGIFLNRYFALFVPLTAMAISDILIGNNYIFIFTWSGFAIIGVLFYLLKSKNKMTLKKTPLIFGTSIASVLMYDLWTNFGCFLGWYPKTIGGLTMCYTVAIPFILWHILSTTIAVGLIVLPILYLKEQKEINLDYSNRLVSKKGTLSLLAVTMILSIVFLLV